MCKNYSLCKTKCQRYIGGIRDVLNPFSYVSYDQIKNSCCGNKPTLFCRDSILGVLSPEYIICKCQLLVCFFTCRNVLGIALNTYMLFLIMSLNTGSEIIHKLVLPIGIISTSGIVLLFLQDYPFVKFDCISLHIYHGSLAFDR